MTIRLTAAVALVVPIVVVAAPTSAAAETDQGRIAADCSAEDRLDDVQPWERAQRQDEEVVERGRLLEIERSRKSSRGNYIELIGEERLENRRAEVEPRAKELERLAEEGDVEAMALLGAIYEEGKGVEQDSTEAFNWFRRAADLGHADSQFLIGFLYLSPEGPPQNPIEASKWFRRAAEQGHAISQHVLGEMYSGDIGITPDYTEMIHWFEQAAEQGVVRSQFLLGQIFRKGLYIPQDYQAAARWYRAAAERGHAEAQVALGVSYAAGQGVPRDLELAHKWLNLAVATMEPSDRRDEVVRARDLAEGVMTPGLSIGMEHWL